MIYKDFVNIIQPYILNWNNFLLDNHPKTNREKLYKIIDEIQLSKIILNVILTLIGTWNILIKCGIQCVWSFYLFFDGKWLQRTVEKFDKQMCFMDKIQILKMKMSLNMKKKQLYEYCIFLYAISHQQHSNLILSKFKFQKWIAYKKYSILCMSK